MKFGKLFFYAVCIAAVAFVVDLFTNVLQSAGFIATDASLTFITFICWAAYFVIGANVNSAIKGLFGFLAGIIAAVCMFELVGVFAGAGMSVGMLAIPLAVFILVIGMLLLEKVPMFNMIAAVFMGTGMFFGLMGTPAIAAKGYFMVGLGELVYAAIGFAAGWLTVYIRVAIEKSANKN